MHRQRVNHGLVVLGLLLLSGLGSFPAAAASPSLSADPVSTAAFPDFDHVVIDDNPPSSYRITDIRIGDINGDGLPDVWTAGRGEGANADQMVWYQNPNWNRYAVSPGDYVYGALGDFDGDGDLDVVAGQHDDDRIYWFENTGQPEQGDWPKSYLGVSPWADVVLAGDIDKDDRLDVVYLYKDSWGWAENPPNPKDTWSDYTIWSGGGRTGGTLADLDRDGDLDVVYGNSWFENPLPGGDPTRGSQWTMRSIDSGWTTEARSVAGDINRDGRLDVVLTGEEDQSGIAWYIGPSDPASGSWTKRVIASSGYEGVHSVDLADFDRDGDLDIFAAEMHHGTDPDKVTVFENVDSSSNTWNEHIFDTIGSHNARAGDLDLDGWPDVVGKNYQAGDLPLQIDLWWNLGSGPLPVDQWERHIIDQNRPWRAVFVDGGDVDGDALPDIVTGGWWYKNPGSPAGTWSRRDIGGELYNMTVLHDLDRDGDLDILGTTGQPGSDEFLWAENSGSGSFTFHTNVPRADGDFLQGARAAQIVPGGNPEVLLSWHNETSTQMYSIPSPATADWSWEVLSSTTNGEQMAVGDIDDDGDLDIHLGTQWLENDGGAWVTHDAFALGDPGAVPDRVELADIDQDGDLDVVIGAEQAEWVAWGEAPANPENPWTEHLIANDILGMSLDVGDLDHDGDTDLVVGEHDPQNGDVGRVMIYQNLNRGASWNAVQIDSGLEHHVGTQFVDIDRDGDLDIISIGWEHSKTVLYENKASSGGGPGNRPPVAVGDAYDVEKGGTISIPAPGVLDNDYDADNDPLTAHRVDGPSHGTLNLSTDGSFTYEHDGSDALEDVFTYEARDGQGGADSATVTITVRGPGSADIRVSSPNDDAEERISDGSVARSGVDLELGEDSAPQLVGLRFQNVNVPRGTNVVRAYLEFSADERHSGDTDVRICGQTADNAAEFGSSRYNISNRPKTAVCVDWQNVEPWTTVHATYRSPDIGGVIEEVVGRGGWSAGNALVLVISGSGRRVAESYNGEPTMAPLLHVEYGGSAPACYVLTRTHTGTGGDPVATPANSAGCGAGQYVAGAVIGLSASPGAGWTVGSWTGTDNDGSTSTTNQVTMPASSRTVTVNYEQAAVTCYALTRAHTGTGGDPVATPANSAGCGAGQYVAGAVIGLSASPGAGWTVGSWTGTDNDGSTSATNQVTMPAAGHSVAVHYLEEGTGGSIDVRVSSSTDDAEERLTDGNTALRGVDLELGEDSVAQLVGLRFRNVDVPRGADVKRAYLEFSADERKSGDTDVRVCGQAADNAPEFSSSSHDISSRPDTATCVDWNDVEPWTTIHNTYRSVDIGPVIEEIVGRGGWSAGNALVLVISGSGRRVAESYNGEPTMAPVLHVEYGGSAPACYVLTRTHTGTGSDPVATPTNSEGCAVGQYVAGAVIGLSASPGAGWTVGSWAGTDDDGSTSATNQVTMPASARTVKVNYEQVPVTCYALTRMHTGTGGDPVATPANSAGCGAGQYVAGAVIGLSASPGAGWTVGSWTGTDNDGSTSTTNQVTMPASSRTVTVNYEQAPVACYALTRTHTGTGGDPVATPANSAGCGAGQYVAGAVIGLSASPGAGWQVGSWAGTDDDGSTSTTNQLTMPASARTVTVNYQEAPAGAILDIRVSASDDDAEEKLEDGDIARSGDDLELGEDRSPQLVGLRFQNVTVPRGATISRAYVEFAADETQGDTTNVTFHAHASDNAAAFGTRAGDISGRPRTTASVLWTNVPPWQTVHATYQSPDLSPVLQEVVNRSGWVAGNALVLVISGSGRRTAEGYDGEPDMAPLLHIEYTAAANSH